MIISVSHGQPVNRSGTKLTVDLDVNTVSMDGETALVLAAVKGHSKCADLLIQAGAGEAREEEEEVDSVHSFVGTGSLCVRAQVLSVHL